MRLSIQGLSDIRERLERLRVEELLAAALAEQAAQMAGAVRERLSNAPDGGDHAAPWARTGALRDSIEASADGLEAAVGSNDPAAAPQEMGTSRIPPRPFLAPVAAGMGEAVAAAIGGRIAAALRGDAGPIADEQRPADLYASSSSDSSFDGRYSRRAVAAVGAEQSSKQIQLAQEFLPFLLEEPPLFARPPFETFPQDETLPPGPGFEWRGRPGSTPGDKEGSWFNRNTREQLRPDMDHLPPEKPHWDYRAPDGRQYRWYPDGTLAPKKA